jgi:hypothetical protein
MSSYKYSSCVSLAGLAVGGICLRDLLLKLRNLTQSRGLLDGGEEDESILSRSARSRHNQQHCKLFLSINQPDFAYQLPCNLRVKSKPPSITQSPALMSSITVPSLMTRTPGDFIVPSELHSSGSVNISPTR